MFIYNFQYSVGKIAEKSSVQECIFDNMALYFKYRINKNAPLQTVFWRFCLGVLKKMFIKKSASTENTEN